jgi:hypothetical protein
MMDNFKTIKGMGQNDPAMAQAARNMGQMIHNMSEMAKSKGSDHPDVQAKSEEIHSMQSRILNLKDVVG